MWIVYDSALGQNRLVKAQKRTQTITWKLLAARFPLRHAPVDAGFIPPRLSSELMSTVEALAQRIAEHPIEVLKATKKAAFTGRDMAAEQSETYTRALTAPLRDSQTSREGVTAFAARRRANYTWVCGLCRREFQFRGAWNQARYEGRINATFLQADRPRV